APQRERPVFACIGRNNHAVDRDDALRAGIGVGDGSSLEGRAAEDVPVVVVAAVNAIEASDGSGSEGIQTLRRKSGGDQFFTRDASYPDRPPACGCQSP